MPKTPLISIVDNDLTPHTGYPMLNLADLAGSSADELVKKRRQLVEELAFLDALIERVRQVPADHVRELVWRRV